MEVAALSSKLNRDLWHIRCLFLTTASSVSSAVRERLSPLSLVDVYFFILRVLTVAGGLLYYLFTAKDYSAHQVFTWFFPLYVLYSGLLYLGILCWPYAARSFYLITLFVDMLLIFVLILFVGLFVGSFFIAFYLLVAIHSFYFGLRVGAVAALVSSLLYGYAYVSLDGASLIPWPDFIVRIGALFLISISLGLIAENEKRQRRILARALDQATLSGRLKDQLLANLSHEVRHPLTFIIGWAEILLEGTYGGLATAHRMALEKIVNSAHDLLAMLSRLLEFSRLKAGDTPLKIEYINVGSLLKETVQDCTSLTRNGSVKLKLYTPDHMVVIKSDRTLLRQIVSNLLSNALKFTDGGHVQVSLLDGDSSDVVRVVVEDTGIGIKADELPTIFDEFRKGSDSLVHCKEGVGLGLAIVKRSLQFLRGDIQVDSDYGKGTKFTVAVPKELKDPAARTEARMRLGSYSNQGGDG